MPSICQKCGCYTVKYHDCAEELTSSQQRKEQQEKLDADRWKDPRNIARRDGMKAGMAGEKMDANTYPEESELHWLWLGEWVEGRKQSRQNVLAQTRRAGD